MKLLVLAWRGSLYWFSDDGEAHASRQNSASSPRNTSIENNTSSDWYTHTQMASALFVCLFAYLTNRSSRISRFTPKFRCEAVNPHVQS